MTGGGASRSSMVGGAGWRIRFFVVLLLFAVEGFESRRTRKCTKDTKGSSRPSCPFVNFVVQIDALVYELYGLTEEKIGIVERQS